MSVRRTIFKSVVAAFASLACFDAVAQDGEYGVFTPYSIYGLGDLMQPGSAYNRSMAGVGIASRNNRYINSINPAAVTARDSLSFMADFSLYQENSIYRQGDMKSAHNTMNINDLVMSFPIYGKSAMMLGVKPYSNTGYGYNYYITDPSVLSVTNTVSNAYIGQGSIYEIFAAVGVTFWNRLSIGAEFQHYFGKIEKMGTTTFADQSFIGIKTGQVLQLNANTAKFGIQYETLVGEKVKLGIGATYQLPAVLGGYIQSYEGPSGTLNSEYVYNQTDTLSLNPNKVRIPEEIGIGVSINYIDKFRAEFDYCRSDWTKSGIDTYARKGWKGTGIDNLSGLGIEGFESTVAQSFRFGVEYTPNRNDIRYYYKKIAYRAGVYYQNSYFKHTGEPVSSRGITLGVTMPIYKWYNGLTLSVDLGQRGSLQHSLIRENYIKFNMGISIFDIWFLKNQYK